MIRISTRDSNLDTKEKPPPPLLQMGSLPAQIGGRLTGVRNRRYGRTMLAVYAVRPVRPVMAEREGGGEGGREVRGRERGRGGGGRGGGRCVVEREGRGEAGRRGGRCAPSWPASPHALAAGLRLCPGHSLAAGCLVRSTAR